MCFLFHGIFVSWQFLGCIVEGHLHRRKRPQVLDTLPVPKKPASGMQLRERAWMICVIWRCHLEDLVAAIG